MSLNRYYREERTFLREDLGPEFSRANPVIASFLGNPSFDPDVERLLDGFAFLTGKIRQKLDDEYPELIYRLLSIICPQFLLPMPSATIIQFEPLPNRLTDSRSVAKGTSVQADALSGTNCTFRTCFDVFVHPLALISATASGGGTRLTLTFRAFQGVAVSNLNLDRIRLYLAGDTSFELYAALLNSGCRCELVENPSERGNVHRLSGPRGAGFASAEPLAPVPGTAFQGYRLLQEYMAFPEKFLFIDLVCGSAFKTVTASEFSIECTFDQPLPKSWRPSTESFRLNCVPAINVFEDESRPIDIMHERMEYRIQPTQVESEIYSVLGARAWVAGTAEPRKYEPLLSLERHDSVTYYTVQTRSGVNDEDRRTYLSLLPANSKTLMPPRETAVFSILCTNGVIASKLRAGDIHRPTDTSPEFARFRNISRTSPYVPISLAAERSWQLLSHLVLSPTILESVVALRSVLELYNFPDSVDAPRARANRGRIQGLAALRTVGRDFVITRDLDPEGHFAGRYGLPIRGRAVETDVQGSNFASEGDLFLFGTVLSHFLSQYATMNSLTSLRVNNLTSGAQYDWLPTAGKSV